MTKEQKLAKIIRDFAEKSVNSLNEIHNSLSVGDKDVLFFYNTILDLYINGEYSTLYDLNGFLRCKENDTPFLGRNDLVDPILFLSNLNSFISNCLLDDALYYVKWFKLDKKEQELRGKKFNLPYRNNSGTFVYVECEPFSENSEPIIMADWSGDFGNQDVKTLNKVVEFAIQNTKKHNDFLSKLDKFKKEKL